MICLALRPGQTGTLQIQMPTIEAFIIRIRLWGPLFRKGTPPKNSTGNDLGPYFTALFLTHEPLAIGCNLADRPPVLRLEGSNICSANGSRARPGPLGTCSRKPSHSLVMEQAIQSFTLHWDVFRRLHDSRISGDRNRFRMIKQELAHLRDRPGFAP